MTALSGGVTGCGRRFQAFLPGKRAGWGRCRLTLPRRALPALPPRRAPPALSSGLRRAPCHRRPPAAAALPAARHRRGAEGAAKARGAEERRRGGGGAPSAALRERPGRQQMLPEERNGAFLRARRWAGAAGLQERGASWRAGRLRRAVRGGPR